MGRQKDPGWFLLPQRNSDMSQVPLEEKEEEALTVTDDIITDTSHVTTPSVVHHAFIFSAPANDSNGNAH